MRKQYGFTLIEMVMVILIMGVLSVVLGKILYQGVQDYTTQQNISETDWQGFIALDRLTNDIHNIRSAGDITTINSNQLTFVDANGTSVQYSLSGTNLLRGNQTLASGISGLTFGYLNVNGATTATASAVRYISVSLTLTQGNLTTSIATLVGTRGLD